MNTNIGMIDVAKSRSLYSKVGRLDFLNIFALLLHFHYWLQDSQKGSFMTQKLSIVSQD
jgi:hypothetical protein